MIAHRESILKANREISRLYRRAYRYLAAAKLFIDEVEDYYRENNALNSAGLAALALDLTNEIFGSQINVIIPRLGVAVLNSVTPHILKPGGEDRLIETDAYIHNPGHRLEKERDLARRLYQESFDAAIAFISRSHEMHDELEKYYSPNMRFYEINRLSEAVLEKILSYSTAENR